MLCERTLGQVGGMPTLAILLYKGRHCLHNQARLSKEIQKMPQNHLQETPKAIRFLRENEEPEIQSRRIESDKDVKLPVGCFILQPMVVLEVPEPIKGKRKVK